MTLPDDQSLIQQARHDPQAFAILYDRFVEPVYRFALRRTGDRLLAEDVTSATFEKALRHMRQHGWKGHSYLAWLYRIAYQQLVLHHRKNYRYADLSPEQPDTIDVEGQAQDVMQYQAIQRAICQLSIDDQEVLTLRLIDRISNPDVAELLRCSPQNVSIRLYRALGRLRQQLERQCECNGGKTNDP